MRIVMETGFYYVYLILIIGVGFFLSIKNKNKKYLILFGAACITLGFGDGFHLIPRAIGLYTNSLDNPNAELAKWLGVGELITSITTTIFYILIYLFIHEKINKQRKTSIDLIVWLLFIARITFCAFPQNQWVTNNSQPGWGIFRNVPFVLLGGLVVVLAYMNLRQTKSFKLLWIVIILSFAFYLPIVILADKYSWVGFLMIPKTVCYLWIAFMGFMEYRKIDLVETK